MAVDVGDIYLVGDDRPRWCKFDGRAAQVKNLQYCRFFT